MIRDLDDIEDFKKWLQTKDARAARLEKEKKEKLERALIEPKHMMDASDHYKGDATAQSPHRNTIHCDLIEVYYVSLNFFIMKRTR